MKKIFKRSKIDIKKYLKTPSDNLVDRLGEILIDSLDRKR